MLIYDFLGCHGAPISIAARQLEGSSLFPSKGRSELGISTSSLSSAYGLKKRNYLLAPGLWNQIFEVAWW
jgi:hypothetical protein